MIKKACKSPNNKRNYNKIPTDWLKDSNTNNHTKSQISSNSPIWAHDSWLNYRFIFMKEVWKKEENRHNEIAQSGALFGISISVSIYIIFSN